MAVAVCKVCGSKEDLAAPFIGGECVDCVRKRMAKPPAPRRSISNLLASYAEEFLAGVAAIVTDFARAVEVFLKYWVRSGGPLFLGGSVLGVLGYAIADPRNLQGSDFGYVLIAMSGYFLLTGVIRWGIYPLTVAALERDSR